MKSYGRYNPAMKLYESQSSLNTKTDKILFFIYYNFFCQQYLHKWISQFMSFCKIELKKIMTKGFECFFLSVITYRYLQNVSTSDRVIKTHIMCVKKDNYSKQQKKYRCAYLKYSSTHSIPQREILFFQNGLREDIYQQRYIFY